MSTAAEVEFDYQAYMEKNTPEVYRGPEARRKRREAARARVLPNGTNIVRAADLEQYAASINSQVVIPELIYLLVKQSISSASVCRIPYGEAVNQPGWDGIVEAESAFLEFVPDGISYWEIGAGNDPQAKASKDFEKRTNQLSADARAQSSFVFVTPRFAGWGEPEQTRWLERRKEKGWKAVRIIDGIKLADWLREFPAVGRWLAKEIGLSGGLGGISTPREHWENIVSWTEPGGPPIPPKLFTEGRSKACSALQALFEGASQKLLLFAEGAQDVADFVAAYLETLAEETARDYASRCLYIAEEDAWLTVVQVRKPHILVANPRLNLESDEQADLLASAMRKGHGVIIPFCGVISGGNPEIIKLQSPSQFQMEKVLIEAGFSKARSRKLAGIGRNRLSALLRHLRGLGDVPPDARWNRDFSCGSPVALEKHFASDPAFFAEIIAIAFRSQNEGEETELSEQRKLQAMNAYRLLSKLRSCPGKLSDGAFDEEQFTNWLQEARRITKETGHSEIAQTWIGHILTNAPKDPNGLWIHQAVASALNERGAGKMRSGFIECFKYQRFGGETFVEERQRLAQQNREKAEALEAAGYSRFATAMRDSARRYEREAERYAKRRSLED